MLDRLQVGEMELENQLSYPLEVNVESCLMIRLAQDKPTLDSIWQEVHGCLLKVQSDWMSYDTENSDGKYEYKKSRYIKKSALIMYIYLTLQSLLFSCHTHPILNKHYSLSVTINLHYATNFLPFYHIWLI